MTVIGPGDRSPMTMTSEQIIQAITAYAEKNSISLAGGWESTALDEPDHHGMVYAEGTYPGGISCVIHLDPSGDKGCRDYY